MDNQLGLSAEDRLYGLSLVWQEANYNFAFFDRIPDMDWDAAYRQYMPLVAQAVGLAAYYDVLARFTALLGDGHTLVVPPRSVYDSLDRPKLILMRLEGKPVVTNVAAGTAGRVPIGSVLLEVDSQPAEVYLAERVAPLVCENAPHRRLDHATARMLLGPRDSTVRCRFSPPGGGAVEMALTRNRTSDPEPWARAVGVPDLWEFVYFDAWFYGERPRTPFEFHVLEGNIAYVALNAFMDPSVATSFHEHLPAMRACAGLILDLRKNHGGNDDIAYDIAEHLITRATETLRVATQRNTGLGRARAVAYRDTVRSEVAALPAAAQEHWRRYHHEWMQVEDWGHIEPAEEHLSVPTVLLTDSETGSAAEDFVMAIASGGGRAVRIGRGTAGSTGQPLIEDLPGGGSLAVCTVRMPWPEAVWERGIEPDIIVEPTIEDLIHGRDAAREAAWRHLASTEVG